MLLRAAAPADASRCALVHHAVWRATYTGLVADDGEVAGSGVGQALLDAVVPAGPAQLWVAVGNPRARRFSARNGFEPDGARYVDEHFGGIVEIRVVR